MAIFCGKEGRPFHIYILLWKRGTSVPYIHFAMIIKKPHLSLLKNRVFDSFHGYLWFGVSACSGW
jgi:hypothetical protein